MNTLLKILLASLLLLPAALCAFGFLASFESGTAYYLAFRTGYALGVISCVAAAGWLGASALLPLPRTQR